jgi:hypothetical protein
MLYIIFVKVGVLIVMTPLKHPSKCPLCSFPAKIISRIFKTRNSLLQYTVHIIVNLVLSLPKVVSWLEGLSP